MFKVEPWNIVRPALVRFLKNTTQMNEGAFTPLTWSRAAILAEFIGAHVEGGRLDVATNSLRLVRRTVLSCHAVAGTSGRVGGSSVEQYEALVAATQSRVMDVVGKGFILHDVGITL